MATAESVVRPWDYQHLNDRRAYERAPLEVPALLDNLKAWQTVRCRDVSPLGVAVQCDAPLPVGEEVEIYFELPQGIAVEARAVVVRNQGGRLGLRFSQIDRNSRLALRAHCRLAQPETTAVNARA